jgi:hypothetical protein
MNRDTLERNEKVQQNNVTTTLAQSVAQRSKDINSNLANLTYSVLVTSGNDLSGPRVRSDEVRKLLQNYIGDPDSIVSYARLINAQNQFLSVGTIEPDAFLEKELERETKAVTRLTALLEAVTQRDEIAARIEKLKAEKQTLADKLAAFRQFQKDLTCEKDWRDQVADFGNSITAVVKTISDLETELDGYRGKLSDLGNKRKDTEAQYREVLTRYDECQTKIALFRAAPRGDAEIPDADHDRAAQAGDLIYTHDDDGALRAVDEGAQAAFLMNPPRIEDVQAVCLAGETMPEKSTYFYPKLADGLVFDLFDARWA